MLRDEAAVLDILAAARAAIEFLGDLSAGDLERDAKTQSAVLHQLLVIGEAAKRVSTGFREKHPDVPWRAMSGMRDKLVHEYDDVDLDEVRNTVVRDLPNLIATIERFAPKEA